MEENVYNNCRKSSRLVAAADFVGDMGRLDPPQERLKAEVLLPLKYIKVSLISFPAGGGKKRICENRFDGEGRESKAGLFFLRFSLSALAAKKGILQREGQVF